MNNIVIFLPDNWEKNPVYDIIINSIKINLDYRLLVIRDSDFEFTKIEKLNPILIIDCDSSKLHCSFYDLECFYNKLESKKLLLTFDDEYMFVDTLGKSQMYDLILSTDYVSVLKMKQLGIWAKHWIVPVKIAGQFSLNQKCEYLVSFVGKIDSMKSGRKKYIDILRSEFDEKDIYLPPINNNYLDEESLFHIYRSSKINLNFSGVSNISLFAEESRFDSIKTGMKARPFEIGGQKGFCLSEYSISLAKMLKNECHIGYFSGEADFLCKIKYYLENEHLINSISTNLYCKTKEMCDPNSGTNLLLLGVKAVLANKKKTKAKLSTTLRSENFYTNRLISENCNPRLQKKTKISNLIFLINMYKKRASKDFYFLGKLIFRLFKVFIGLR